MPVTTLATPWPQPSRVLSECVSVRSSTSFAVINDSSRPTTAIANAYGAMIRNVSNVYGTSGSNHLGKLSGNSPLSPTVGMSQPITSTNRLTPTTTTSGAGTTVVTRGSTAITPTPRATKG